MNVATYYSARNIAENYRTGMIIQNSGKWS